MNTSLNSATTNSPLNNYVTILKKYNDYSGRARRSEYWYFVLINTLVSQSLVFLNALLFNGSVLFSWLLLLVNLAILVPTVAVAIRRMHDVGKSGWYMLIPIYNLILACTEGTNASNPYGPDPKLKA
ncbi:DUF805 domain-containing protein [Spirosoma flavum]|uniref:DUF805 domain-containing protein n=1 Tax=Spirosoma flavum TaxID=2048557 RepID=A0ABW6AL11_9BACT